MIKLLVFDVDNTLTPSSSEPIVDSSSEAINLLQEKGYLIVIASGRQAYAIPSIEGRIHPDYYVGGNGSAIFDADKKIIEANYLPKDLFDKVNQYCQINDVGLFWKFTNNNYVYHNDEKMKDIINILKNCDNCKNPDNSALPTAGGIISNKEKAYRFKEDFASEFTLLDGGAGIYDIDLIGINKAYGIKKLINRLNIREEEIMVFGDSDNDISMLQLNGISIVMGNGSEEAKKYGDYITDIARNDGIIKALKKYELL